MNDSLDVIVIGAGPVGSFSAMKLARSGLQVMVCEEHEDIGTPAHCAGHINIRGLERLRLHNLPPKVYENTYRGATFHSPSGKSFEVHMDSPVTCAVNRELFDKYIAQKAREAGAQYSLDTRVENLKIGKNSMDVVTVGQHGRTHQIRGKMVIDAEGVSSRMLAQTGLSRLNPRMLLNGVEAEVENIRDVNLDTVEVFLGADCAPGFYAWLMPKKDGRAKVGLGARARNPMELLRRLMFKHPVASKKLQKARILRSVLHPITLGGPIRKAYASRFLAVGDAASQVKPTTGGGVVLGITCAAIAAGVAEDAIRLDDFSSEFLRNYQQKTNETIGFDSRMMLRMRKILDEISDARMDTLIALCSRIGLDETLRNVRDIDLQGRALLSVLRSPRALTVLGYFLLTYFFGNL